ncbi:hypothetical protein HDF24_04150 [Mucilaginibacter sp. X4EP1]|uniref:hypothetical protein n=1 Tax=Mucilaginibacter sp. X4EP1 TaxID=2723092 RepID=UPI00216708CF|nr:hypothetical protein [Mucilaginibacter sp. X4EP1]MCS3816644.1 hypothetical protein [Mucilaginibacter sp. X4EP1]
MEKPLHIQLLEILSKEGIGRTISISSFLINHFEKPLLTGTDNENRLKHDRDIRPVQLFISDLTTERGFIISDLIDDKWIVWAYNVEKPLWFDEISANFYITSTGLDYLEQYEYTQAQLELNKSYKTVNEASLLNYKIQLWGTAITILIAGLAAFYSIQSYLKPEPKMTELNKNVRLLSTGLDSIKSQINHLQSQKTLPVEKYHKH